MSDLIERLRDYATTGSRPWLGISDVFAEAADEITSLRERAAVLEAALADPNAVHVNMLRGGIARPSIAQIIHVYGEDALRAHLLTSESDNG